ncbi:outer membrane lipoprotein carrier protein LolA [Streptomyces sp. NPDC090026]|uniref:LolA family protein n=1 Tax=Streptomyces sp. NPDC090026 TaxID=3365923 RepID=UPI0038171D4B
MAPNDSAHSADREQEPAAGRRKAARYAVPMAVAAVAAGTIGLVPALAASGDPELPEITARQLIEKIAASDTQQLSGTVKISTDLGLPALDGLAGAVAGGADSSADPQSRLTELATGTHTLRVAADGPDRQRLTVVDGSDEYTLIHDGDELWAYDSASNEVFHAEDPEGSGPAAERDGAPLAAPLTPKELTDRLLELSGDTTSYEVDGTARIAGRDAYRLVVRPEQKGSTVGAVTIAVDSRTGTPLKATLTASDGGKAVVDVGFTRVDFAKPAASTFSFTPPKGARVTEADEAAAREAAEEAGSPVGELLPGGGAEDVGAVDVIGEGWTAVAVLEGPSGGAGHEKAPSAADGLPGGAGAFLDSLGDKVSGKFGTGTVFSTRLVNALLTDDGTVYVGAVTKDALIGIADGAR